MEDETGAHDPVIRRLQALAGEPVDANTTHRVLAATRHPRRTWWRSARVKVCLGVAGGFLVGSAGLASAGSLPGAAQGAAHTVLGTVGVSVPPGHDRYNDPTACPGGPYANHGAYVRSHKADPNAGQSPCGKPTRSVNGASNANGQQPPATGNNGNGNNGSGNNGFGYGNSNGNGPPPWAHGNKNNNGNGNGMPTAMAMARATTATAPTRTKTTMTKATRATTSRRRLSQPPPRQPRPRPRDCH